MRHCRFTRLIPSCVMLAILLCLSQPQTNAQNVYNTGFENFTSNPLNWQGWSADNGVWQIGAPPSTSGPGAAYDGLQCAGTAMSSGAYQVNISSRLISPVIKLPPVTAGQQLLLTFWQWFKWSQYLYGGENGTTIGTGNVQISTDNGTTWSTVSNPASGNSPYYGYGTFWSLASVDLTAYANKTIQFAFQQNGGTDTFPGWYVDDISLDEVTSQYLALNQTVGFENFTSSNWQGWSADNGVWQVGAPTAASGPGAAQSGLQCAGTALVSGVYPVNTNSRLISPPAILPTLSANQKITLTFWQWFNWDLSANGYPPGTGDVQVSKWISGAWGPWATVSPVYSGNSDGWGEVGVNFATIDLTAYAGQQIQIAFQQNAGYDYGDGGEYYDNGTWPGWYIDNVTVSIPNLAPSLTSMTPNTAAVGSANTTITLTGLNFAADAQVQWNGVALATNDISATKLTATIPASDLATAGTFSVTVLNPDANGGTSNAAAFKVIVPGLIVGFTSPSPSSVLKGNVTITGSITDTLAVLGAWTLTLNGIVLGSGTGGNPSVAWNTQLWADGEHSLTLAEKDAAGHTATASLTIYVNNLGVSSIAITRPTAGEAVKGTVTVTGSIYDLTPGAWTLADNGVQIGSGTGGSPNVSWNTTTMGDGTNKLVLTETDLAGHTATATTIVTVNNTGVSSVSITAPAAGAIVTGTVTVTGTIKDATLGTWTLDCSGEQIATGTGKTVSASWNTTLSSEGSHTLLLTETDAAGNKSSATISVTVNNKGVTAISITSPANGATVRGAVIVKGTITDATIGSWKLTDNGTQIGSGTGAAPDVSWVTTSETDSSHTLILTETDAAGHSGSASITVTVNNTGVSAIAITAPANNATVKGQVTITGTITDGTPGNWTLTCDGVQLAAGTGKSVSVPWNTKVFANGSHILILTETDAAGNIGSATVTVTVSN